MAHGAPEERDQTAESGYDRARNEADEHYGESADELRVQRAEEELGTGTRIREAGAVRVRKSVHTDHEEFRVPKRREEIEIERIPVEGEAREAPEGTELGEDEVIMQVYEEEIVVSKRLVPKEEIRLRKEVVEEEEVIEEDVRREEVEIEDQTYRGARRGE